MFSQLKSVSAYPAAAAPSTSLVVALAGKRGIRAEHLEQMSDSLSLAFRAIDDCLIDALDALPNVSARPRLTLLTGLADGADQIAGRLFLSEVAPSGSTRVLGAVLPCPGDEFARNSPVEDLRAFEASADSCAFISVLRGHLRPPPAVCLDSQIALQVKRERDAAFVAQAEALLYDADLLIAVDDPDDAGDIGGTRDTLTRAYELGVPVILLHLGRAGVRLMWPGEGPERRTYFKGLAARHAIQALVAQVLELRDEPAAMTA